MGTLDAYRKFELDCMVGSFQHSDTAMRHRVTNLHDEDRKRTGPFPPNPRMAEAVEAASRA
jgi:hypothetical protein